MGRGSGVEGYVGAFIFFFIFIFFLYLDDEWLRDIFYSSVLSSSIYIIDLTV